MTNTIATVTAVLITTWTSTNWTGVVKDGKELGYIQTNRTCAVHVEDKRHEWTLDETPGNVAVWQPVLLVQNLTNIYGSNWTWPTNQWYYNGQLRIGPVTTTNRLIEN